MSSSRYLGMSMEKWFCWSGMGVAGLFLVLFVLDMVLAIPFGGLNTTLDVVSILACAILVYLGWNAYADMK